MSGRFPSRISAHAAPYASIARCNVKGSGSLLNVTPELRRDRSVGQIPTSRGRDVHPTARKMPARDREQAAFAQLPLDQEMVHVAPGSALDDDLLFHELIADCPALCAFDDVKIRLRAVPCGVANHALDVAAHLFRCDLIRHGHPKKSRRNHRNDAHGEQVDELQSRVGFVDVMDDEMGVAIEQSLPGSSDGLDMQMQPGSRMFIEEGAQQQQHLGHGREVANDDTKLALLTHDELTCVIVQTAQLMQEDSGSVVKRTAGIRQRHPIAAAIEQGQSQLRLQILHRREDSRLHPPELVGSLLEPTRLGDGVKAPELMERDALDHSFTRLRQSEVNSVYQISDRQVLEAVARQELQAMRAIVTKSYGDPDVLSIEKRLDPNPSAGRVLIEVKAFGINHAETHMRAGQWPETTEISGIECVGLVRVDPSGRLSPGQKVVAFMGGMGRSINGSYAELTNVPASNVLPVKSELAWEVLAAIPESYATAWAALFGNLDLKASQSILIRGATSALGQAAVNIAAHAGARVIATTRNPKRAETLEALGAKEVVLEAPDLPQRVREQYPRGVDAVLELIGNSTVVASLSTVRRGGRLCLAGFLGGLDPIPTFVPVAQLPSGVHFSFFGSFMFGSPEYPATEIPMQTIVERVENGIYKAKPARVFRFEEIREAHRLMEAAGANGKIVVRL